MAGLRRQKICLDDDPLAMMGNSLADDDEEEEEEEQQQPVKTAVSRPVVSQANVSLPAPASIAPKVAVTGVIPELPAKKKSIFDDDDDDLLIHKTPAATIPVPESTPKPAPIAIKPASVTEVPNPPAAPIKTATSSQSSTSAVSPKTQPIQPKKEDYDGDDLFTYNSNTLKSAAPLFAPAAAATASTNSTSISPKPTIAKIDFNKDDDDISDLKVAQILEKEENLDYKLFGRVDNSEVVTQRVQKRLDDLDREDEFLRQLDELTTKASVSSTGNTVAPTTITAAPTTASASSSTAANTDIDISAFDLNAYIAQEASSGGGLFDD